MKKDFYDRSTMWVIAIASFSIALSLVIMGGASYLITEKAAIDKLKSKDLFYILDAASEKIDGRITRAKETSVLLAQDPFLNEWIAEEEADTAMTARVEQKLKKIAEEHDYSSTFVVSKRTQNYWSERGLIGTVSASNPNDAWFFAFVELQSLLEINIDYNEHRDNTYVFINALMGTSHNSIGAAGVGLDLKDIAEEFAGYNSSKAGSLWLTDKTGKIQLAGNLDYRGKQMVDFLPSEVNQQIILHIENHSSEPGVLEYRDSSGELYDIAFKSLKAADWLLVLQIPRVETIGFLQTIKTNTLIAALISLISIILVFYLISTRIANPLKRAIRLSQELENQVEERTRELRTQNQKIMDSIDYAEKLQQTIIPSEALMREVLPNSFLIWKPRDIVGGDFYWLDKKKDSILVVVGDCTGHGVPGALMTMAVVPILQHIVHEFGHQDPGAILKEVNVRLRAALQKDKTVIADEGLDLGVCIIKQNKIKFAGAKTDLYLTTSNKVEVVRGDRKSIGYRRGDPDYNFSTVSLNTQEIEYLYLTTDGFLDQNGGPKNHSYGKKRFVSLIEEVGGLSTQEQRQRFVQSFEQFKESEPQRDDVTVIGFQVNPKK